MLQELKTAEAIVSFLDEDGAPTICKKAKILPPQSQMGPIDDITRQAAILAGGLRDKYATMIDRDSAYEFLVRLNQEQAAAARKAAEEAEAQKQAEGENDGYGLFHGFFLLETKKCPSSQTDRKQCF